MVESIGKASISSLSRRGDEGREAKVNFVNDFVLFLRGFLRRGQKGANEKQLHQSPT